jgi:hypothetical protein
VVVVEGIYLLKRELRAHHDVSLWIDCSFETALERALAREQEGSLSTRRSAPTGRSTSRRRRSTSRATSRAPRRRR